MSADEQLACSCCEESVHWLEVFPNGVCLSCWADSPEGRRMPTAGEVRSLWGQS
jgi:hypothetical protein